VSDFAQIGNLMSTSGDGELSGLENAGTASTRPIASAAGYGVNEYLFGSIVDRECNHGSAAGWNCPKAGCYVVENRSLVRHPCEHHDRLLNLCQVSIRYLTSRVLNDP
jgi:hypothetical protein